MMTAKELLEKLTELKEERSDFDSLEIRIEMIDRDSYAEEQASDGNDHTSTVIGDGVLYGMGMAEGRKFVGDAQVSTGHFVLLLSVEIDEKEIESGVTGVVYQVR